MITILALFNRFKRPAYFLRDGEEVEEKVVFDRVGKSASSNFKMNFVYTCLLQENTQLRNGDIMRSSVGYGKGEPATFLVVSVRKTELSIQATVYKCNGTAEIYRQGESEYDEDGEEVHTTLEKIGEFPVNHMTVNAHMRLLDAGLLPATTKEFRMPVCDIREMDRIILDGQKFCVDAIDKTKFDGLYAVQTSNDNRTFDETKPFKEKPSDTSPDLDEYLNSLFKQYGENEDDDE